MAKIRRHGPLHHERFLASFGHADGHPASAADLPDLGEAEVWAATAPDDGADGEEGARNAGVGASRGGSGGRMPRPQVVHRYRNAGGSVAGGASESRRRRRVAATGTVPGWGSPPGGGESSGGGGGEWVPPHEYLARARERECFVAAGRGGSAAGPVSEGVGRSLKGRDLLRLRDAVWSLTGFSG